MNPIAAMRAYTQAANLGQQNRLGSLGQKSGGQGEDFGAMVSNALQSVAGSARASDQQASKMAAGKADLVDVVTAVAETEVAIESLVSVRDKVIQAYEEIMRMPI